MTSPMFIIFSGALIVIIGSTIVAVGTLLQNKASSEKSTKQTEKIEELTNKNAELSTQLSNAALQLSGEITGGDSFCEVQFIPTTDYKQVKIVLFHHGKFPIQDLLIKIIDKDAFDQIGNELRKSGYKMGDPLPKALGNPFLKAEKNIKVGTLQTNLAVDHITIPLILSGSVRKFNITTYARNGIYTQHLIYTSVDSKWISSTVITNGNGKIMLNKKDPKFPDDKLEW